MIRLLHRLAAIPSVYDAIQFFTGMPYTRYRLAQHIKGLPQQGLVLDVGAGTGLYRHLWSDRYRYLCLDLDSEKITGFTDKHQDSAVQGDGTQLPFKTDSLDIIVCIAVTHHLDEAGFARFLDEIERTLKVGGTFLYFDAVWSEKRLPSRILWALDRGSNPRPNEIIETALSQHFKVRQIEHFAMYHRYILASYTK